VSLEGQILCSGFAADGPEASGLDLEGSDPIDG
jgi:hypothetical protein